MDEISGFDRPLFKKLAHNDTGGAAGHQGGIVIPKEMEDFFPQLSARVTAAAPTNDEQIRAELFAGDEFLGTTSTRYQFQTWGATRPPERRLTGNLSQLRNVAAAGDYLTIERSLEDRSLYRLRLIKIGTPAFAAFERSVGSRRWGPVEFKDKPVSEREIERADEQQTAHESAPFDLFDPNAIAIEVRTTRISRSRVFQTRLSDLYVRRCVVCERAFASPTGPSEIEAAHIVPRSRKGADDARNGIALCRSHHWAFDNGLFGVTPTRQVFVPPHVAALAGNAHLVEFRSKVLLMPTVATLSPALDALGWHMHNVVAGA